MSRTHWLAILGILGVGVGVALRLRWPIAAPALICAPQTVRWIDAGTMWVASCTKGASLERPPAGPMMTLGAKLNLNEASAGDLALIPGIGPKLAGALVRARGERGAFRSWEEVNAVTGVGPAKLGILKEWSELR